MKRNSKSDYIHRWLDEVDEEQDAAQRHFPSCYHKAKRRKLATTHAKSSPLLSQLYNQQSHPSLTNAYANFSSTTSRSDREAAYDNSNIMSGQTTRKLRPRPVAPPVPLATALTATSKRPATRQPRSRAKRRRVEEPEADTESM